MITHDEVHFERRIALAMLALFLLVLGSHALAADCPAGCSCLNPADAKKMGYEYCSGQQVLCGYDRYQAALYCFRTGATPTPTVTSLCPSGCSCMPESDAKVKFGTYTRCSETPCGPSASVAANIPPYCFRPATTPVPLCPAGCFCILESEAKVKFGTYARCSETPCGPSASVAANIPPYCFRPVTPEPVCPQGCACLNEEDAKLKGLGVWCGGVQKVCGSQQTATSAAVRNQYCYQIPVQPECPAECSCILESEAKAKFGTYTRCSEKPCGPSAAATANLVPYCFKPATPPQPLCKEGCTCLSQAAAKEKGFTPCRGVMTSCGYDQAKNPLYCFEVVPDASCSYDYEKKTCTGSCQQGNTCGIIAREKDATGGITYAVCGCTPPPADSACAFNKDAGSCTGTCQNGGSCAIIGKEINAQTGEAKITCGCQQDVCYFDYAKNACTGLCTAGTGVCQLNTIYRDATGKTLFGECHCKEKGENVPAGTVPGIPGVPPTCTCDTAGGGCRGDCPAGQTCWMTATATNNEGKNICTSCSCKETCTLDANNQCSGSCPDGSQCIRQVYTDPATGAEKVSCGCGGAPVTTATPRPAGGGDIFASISSFFRSLFGLK